MRTVGSAFGKLYSGPWDRQTVRIYLLGPDTTGTYLPFVVVVVVVCCLVTILLQHRQTLFGVQEAKLCDSCSQIVNAGMSDTPVSCLLPIS